MGNRGMLHDEHKRLGAARWKGQTWIHCSLQFQERRRTLMAPHSYTELFFLDEATAMAAGHRPCRRCQQQKYQEFQDCWLRTGRIFGSARDMDRQLHAGRVGPDRSQVRHEATLSQLPVGAMFYASRAETVIYARLPGGVGRWSFEGYTSVDEAELPDSLVSRCCDGLVRSVRVDGDESFYEEICSFCSGYFGDCGLYGNDTLRHRVLHSLKCGRGRPRGPMRISEGRSGCGFRKVFVGRVREGCSQQ